MATASTDFDPKSSGEAGMSAEAVLALRRTIYAKDGVTRGDLADLIARGRDAGPSPEYSDLLAEVATDLLVRQADPPRYIAPADAAWLIERLSEGGGLTCRAEFEMLEDVMRYAVSVPPQLTAFAVREVAKAIMTGRRAATGGVDHAAGIVTRDDVEALRGMVFAATEGSSMHVSKGSAEVLFDIAHATANADNDPGFADFFAKAVGNYLIGIAFHGTAAKEDILRREAAPAPRASFSGFLGQMTHPTRRPGLSTARQEMESVGEMAEDAFAQENAANEEEAFNASQIGAAGADWVAAHLTREGELTVAEKHLLIFLREEAAAMPRSLTALIEKAA